MASKYRPKTKEELVEAIKKEIYEVQGSKNKPNWRANLNCIDVSNMTNISFLFSKRLGLEKFNGDISKWDVSNVEIMRGLFENSYFNGDISKWNVSNVKIMAKMFWGSDFNGDISKWDVSNVKDMNNMFVYSQFNGNISNWDVSNVENMSWMFAYSQFNGDISKWNISNVKYMSFMFSDSQFNQDISKWDVSNVRDMSFMFFNSEFNRDISKWNVKNIASMSYMFKNSKFNGDIGSWPLKEETDLKNISVSSEYNRLPDKIIFSETFQNILNKKEILYKPETIAKLFIYSLEKKDKNFDLKTIFEEFLKEKKEYYQNKGYKSNIIKKLILNDITEILKHLKSKEMQQKFIEITMNKNNIGTDLNIHIN